MKEPGKKYNDEENMLVNDLRSIVSKARSKAFAAVNYSVSQYVVSRWLTVKKQYFLHYFYLYFEIILYFLQSIVRNNVRLWTSKSAKNLFIETIGLERRNKYQCTISKSETVFHLFDIVHLLSYEMTPYNTTISLCLY